MTRTRTLALLTSLNHKGIRNYVAIKRIMIDIDGVQTSSSSLHEVQLPEIQTAVVVVEKSES